MGYQRIHTEEKDIKILCPTKSHSKSNAETSDTFPLKLGMGNMLIITVYLPRSGDLHHCNKNNKLYVLERQILLWYCFSRTEEILEYLCIY